MVATHSGYSAYFEIVENLTITWTILISYKNLSSDFFCSKMRISWYIFNILIFYLTVFAKKHDFYIFCYAYLNFFFALPIVFHYSQK